MRNGKGSYIWLLFCVLTLPVMLILNIWQSCRYEKYQERLQSLEKEQGEWVESNKRIISAIAVYSSPGRIARVAEDTLKLDKVDSDNVILIDFGGREADQ